MSSSKIFVGLSLLLSMSALAVSEPNNELLTLKLDKKENVELGSKGVATGSALCSVLLNNEVFRYHELRPYMIRISRENMQLADIPPDHIVTFQGQYFLSSRGISPNIGIRGATVISNVPSVAVPSLPTPVQDLQSVVEQMNEKWKDDNITTGTNEVKTGQWRGPVDINSAGFDAKLVFREELGELTRESASALRKIDVKVKTLQFTESDIDATALALAAANDDTDGTSPVVGVFKEDIKTLIQRLGNSSSILTISATARIANNGDVTDMRSVSLVTFLNTQTRQYVRIFAVEGRI